MHLSFDRINRRRGYGPSSERVLVNPFENPFDTCEIYEWYCEMKEEAQHRLLASSYGDVVRNLKLVLYVEHRAMREQGYVV